MSANTAESGMTQSSAADTFQQVAVLVRQTLALPETEPIKRKQLFFTTLALRRWIARLTLSHRAAFCDQHSRRNDLPPRARRDARERVCRGRRAQRGGPATLIALLRDSPAEIFPARIHATTLPRYCTVADFVRLVDHKLMTGQ